MSKDQQRHIDTLRYRYEQRLRVLKEKAAIFGYSTPPEIIMEIEDIEAQLVKLDQNVFQSNSSPAGSQLPSQTNRKRIQQRELVWWASIASMTIFVVVFIQWLASGSFKLINQPSLLPSTGSELSVSTQPTLLPTPSLQASIVSPNLHEPTRSIEPTRAIPAVAQCQSDAYEFVREIPPQPSAAGDVEFGEGLVATVQGNYLYVAHTTQGVPQIPHILKLTITGTLEVDWQVHSGTGQGEFGFAQAIAVSDHGNVYVADGGGRNRIQKLNSNGEFQIWISESSGARGLNDPRSIAIDKQDNLYIADTLNNRILKFDNTGKLLVQWGSAGNGKGQFAQPWGISIDVKENIIYVADMDNNRIQKFDSVGNYQGEWGTKGTGDGQFTQPRGISVDSRGNVYVADSTNHRVQKFSSIGTCLAKWGHEGKGIGQFHDPRTISIGADGLIYVADSGNHRIQVFRAR